MINQGTEATVKLSELTKWYGPIRGIDRLSFEMYRGEVFGFLGPNGSGKTTAMRSMLGLIKPTSGSCLILGSKSVGRDVKVRNRIGYLPGIAATYDTYTARGYLNFIARMRRLDLAQEINELAARLDLGLDQHIHDLSKGNRQKVSLVQAFMHKPELLLLDEPTSGLDPIVQREFEALLAEVTQRGGSVLLSSHVLSEVEHLADRVAILKEGRALVIDEISALKAQARRCIELQFENPVRTSNFERIENIRELSASGSSIRCIVTGSEYALLKRAVELGVIEVRSEESTLEEIFMDLIGAK